MTSIDWQHLSREITNWGKALGFADVSIAELDLSGHQEKLDDWLDKGHHGEMDYMSRHGDMRSRPDKLHPGTTSAICLRLDYLDPDTRPETILASDRMAYVSRYALGRDYHKVIRGKLKKLVSQIGDYLTEQDFHEFNARVFTDSAPLLEKALAENAGLGWIGKNTLLLNEKAGSWFFLAEVLTNLPLAADAARQKNRCGSCQACIDVCPTDAFVAPYELDARRCISYLTIEHRGSIPENLRPLMGNRIFGCDDCQLICPWNRYASASQESDFSPRHGLAHSDLLELFKWSEDEFLRKTEGSAIRRTGYRGWIRNLAVAIGNSSAPGDSTDFVLKSRKGWSDLTDEHIDWAINRLSEKS